MTGDSPLIDLSTTEVGGHISSDELQELPAANRNYMAFIGNVPGTVFVPSGEFLNDSFQANGQPTAANAIIFDGANNTDEQRGSNVGGQTRAANESIQEVQIMTNQFDAEYGRASGAVINAVTKSGTNQFRGSAFGFFTSKAVTARDFFARAAGDEKPDVGKQEWGGTFGGPIKRNKLFFFGSLERLVAQTELVEKLPAASRVQLRRSPAKNRPGTRCGASTISSARTTRGRSAGCARSRRSSIGSTATQETLTSYGDETDLDQTLVGTLTSVLSNTKVNTVRVRRRARRHRARQPGLASARSRLRALRAVPGGCRARHRQRAAAPGLRDLRQPGRDVTMDYSIQRS